MMNGGVSVQSGYFIELNEKQSSKTPRKRELPVGLKCGRYDKYILEWMNN